MKNIDYNITVKLINVFYYQTFTYNLVSCWVSNDILPFISYIFETYQTFTTYIYIVSYKIIFYYI